MKRVAAMALCLLLAMPCAAQGASGRGGVSVTPLEDEFAGQSAPLYTPPGPKGTASGQPAEEQPAEGSGNVPGAGPGVSSHVPPKASEDVLPAYGGGGGKDAVVIAYLIDLARKRNRPCPSGATLPAPPSLTFSEPLCKAARAVREGAEPLAAMAEQGVRAVGWRTFSAVDAPAQRVVNGLRDTHCEALLEPYTHIGAYRDSSGWSILFASLAESPAEKEGAPAPENSGETSREAAAPSPAREGESRAGAGIPGAAALPAEAASSGGGRESPPMNPAPERGPERAPDSVAAGQEARALFSQLNELRAKGGTCFSKAMPPAGPLAFNPELQAAAERDARAGYGANARPSEGGAALYRGSNVTKLTLRANNHASVALDVWTVNPSQCEALLSPMFTDAGVAYEDGRWVLILGGRNEGVPSDK